MHNITDAMPSVSAESDTSAESEPDSRKKKPKKTIGYRTASRLIAVQGLYTMSMSNKRPSEVVAEIQELHDNSDVIKSSDLLSELYDDIYKNFDLDYTISLLCGISREQKVIDPVIIDLLPEKWPLKRLDKVICAILRAGTYELLFSPEIPPKVIINEYTNLGSTFQLNHDNALINGILNSIYQSHNG